MVIVWSWNLMGKCCNQIGWLQIMGDISNKVEQTFVGCASSLQLSVRALSRKMCCLREGKLQSWVQYTLPWQVSVGTVVIPCCFSLQSPREAEAMELQHPSSTTGGSLVRVTWPATTAYIIIWWSLHEYSTCANCWLWLWLFMLI